MKSKEELEKSVEKRFIGPNELARFLDISVNTVYSWVCMRRIPFVKMGRLVKFDLKDIDKWLQHYRQEPHKEMM